jgi:hypothetical protein
MGRIIRWASPAFSAAIGECIYTKKVEPVHQPTFMIVGIHLVKLQCHGARFLQRVSTNAFEAIAMVSEAGEACSFPDFGDHILGNNVDVWGDATEGSIGAEALQGKVGYARQSFDRAKLFCYQCVVNGSAFLAIFWFLRYNVTMSAVISSALGA